MFDIYMSQICFWSDIKHAYYINLAHRTDRNVHVQAQLKTVGINANRFNAIRTINGAIGCSLSHLNILVQAKRENLPHVLIVEDDIVFLEPKLLRKSFDACINKYKNEWDVILLGGNNTTKFTEPEQFSVRVNKCQTTTGYLVNGHYIDTLIQNIKMGVSRLIETPNLHMYFAIDKFWFHLQGTGRWYLIMPLSVIQCVGHSDIENRTTNYSNLMLDITKPYFRSHPKPHP